jgi:diguanylate cyclase (GGDEF)-like protein
LTADAAQRDGSTAERPLSPAQQGLQALRTAQADQYAGGDPANAARLVALLCLLIGFLTFAFLPLDPPTARGWFGWPLAIASALLNVIVARRLLRANPPPPFRWLLTLSYAGLLQIALLCWLAGGAASAYQSLLLLWIGAGMGIHPPRQALTFLLAAAAVASLPLVYEGWSSSAAANIAASLLLWSALGTAMMVLMVGVRAQRVRLRAAELRESGLAREDPLTGLANRRAFDEALTAEMARSERAGSKLSILLIDLDRFKAVNDELGHLEGDRCLALTGAAIARRIRAGDRAFRWGGDEFVVLLPGTQRPGVLRTAERLRAAVAEAPVALDGASVAVTVSVGWANWSGDTPDDLLLRADRALYAAKDAGRDAVRPER